MNTLLLAEKTEPKIMTAEEVAPLQAELKAHRLAQYIRLQGGFPVPLAGAAYWLLLGFLGYSLSLADWVAIALPASGAIFPLALLFAAIFKCPFMKDKSAVGDVLLPALISMLLFWPMIIVAAKTAPNLIPLILAIGMSIHWPVIGWAYGRTGLYSTHAIIRAFVCTFICLQFPEHTLTWMPLSVAAIYLFTLVAIVFDVRRLKIQII